ncbi:long-chain-fatty-acid--CoA ligase [Nonomuraea lactucae]|uniref:long-chain-fatty-acid--CoA ligase n=1 Tax=Nonomuraea lactucae TaxID=2249762 RepID=UPI000DE4E7AF|nr:long-chain fatty acid--CoA ligase [Nonomuraea lactucae]
MNIASHLWARADQEPVRPAIRSDRGNLTYSRLRAACGQVAQAVLLAGFRPGERVVLIAPTIFEFPIAYYGLQAAGLTVITMNPMATSTEIEYVLRDSGATLVLGWHECDAAAEAAAGRVHVEHWKLHPGASFDVTPLAEPCPQDPADTAVILYTSGTTGNPKGAELTASNLLSTADAVRRVMALTDADRFGTALPLFHVFGQAVIMNTVLAAGGSLSLLTRFDAREALELVRRDRLTGFAGVPTMWNAMLQASEGFGPADLADLRLGVSGGASLPVEVLRTFQERFGCTILEGYGLTETTGLGTFNAPPRPGTVGVAVPGTSVEIRKDGAPAPAGEAGEVFIKGPGVMKGYWNRPEATAEELADGWLRTGDLGVLDDGGYLTIVGRLKELIIRGGYNVYPREVEEVLYQHPDIVEAAVVGVPHEHYGEEVGAVIALRPGAELTPDALRSWAKERLSAYKVPRLFRFVSSLPKGPTGKILKRAIDRATLS